MKEISLVLLMLVVFGATFVVPTKAQETPEMITIQPGQDNVTGGTYCFDGDHRINSLWQVVGPQWREALAVSENDYLRGPLLVGNDERPREFVRHGVTYYSVMRGECLFVPPPIRARVGILANPAEKTAVSMDFAGKTASVPWWKYTYRILIGIILTVVLLMALYYIIYAILLLAQRYWSKKQDRQWQEKIPSIEDPFGSQETFEHDPGDTKELPLINDWKYKNPSLAGEPIVKGGFEAVPDQERYSTVVRELTMAAVWSIIGTEPPEWRVVGDIVRGHLVDCEGMVRYASTREPELRRFTKEPAFQALMQHVPTGEQHLRYVLWACLNGAWLNMVDGTLNFIPDTMEKSGEVVTLSSPIERYDLMACDQIICPTAGEIDRYGKPLADPRHDAPRIHLVAW